MNMFETSVRYSGMGSGLYSKPKPSWPFVLKHPAHWVSTAFGAGLVRFMPGTWGSLLGWLFYSAVEPLALHQPVHFALGLALAFLVCVLCCHITGRALQQADHSCIVMDEFFAVLCLLFIAGPVCNSLTEQLVAVAVFRGFDILKPWPIRIIDANIKNGWGVMLDDLVAVFMSLWVLACFYQFNAFF